MFLIPASESQKRLVDDALLVIDHLMGSGDKQGRAVAEGWKNAFGPPFKRKSWACWFSSRTCLLTPKTVITKHVPRSGKWSLREKLFSGIILSILLILTPLVYSQRSGAKPDVRKKWGWKTEQAARTRR